MKTITITIIILLILGILTYFPGQIKAEDSLKREVINSTKEEFNKDGESSNAKERTCFKLDKNAILQDSISNLIGGVIFSLILFGLNEYIFRQKNLTGEWCAKNKTTKTSYNPHMGVTIEYKIHILQLGTQISGYGEKIKDLKADGSLHHEYPPEKRAHIEIEGHFERNFLRRSKLYLLIKENGTNRASSISIELTIPIFKKTELSGKFIWTASNSNGTSSWSKVDYGSK